MRRSAPKLLVGVGLLLVVAGSLLSWATVRTVGGDVEVGGWSRGAPWVLAGGVIAAVGIWSGHRLLAGAVAGMTAAALAVAMYALPGDLVTQTSDAYEARLGAGLFLSMAGSAVLFVTALRRSG